uniref:Uncharacterized protein n=1 Tax=Nelumbo nucifera TaxID=4432 RepID=A0A822ZXK3_NELNU|nr:TPA_asm: hypothetical protein HUJ06_017513 [Nelumbo nucifera]
MRTPFTLSRYTGSAPFPLMEGSISLNLAKSSCTLATSSLNASRLTKPDLRPAFTGDKSFRLFLEGERSTEASASIVWE